MKKNEPPTESAVIDTINNTKNESENEEWRGIGKIKIKCKKKPVFEFNTNDEILAIKTYNKNLYQLRDKPLEPKMFPVTELQDGDLLLEKVIETSNYSKSISYKYQTFNKEKTNILLLETDLMRLIGYWLAEGSLAKNNKGSNGKKSKSYKQNIIYYKYRVNFSFNINETKRNI